MLTAAGSGQRFGADLPKALVLLRGRPLVAHATSRIAASGVVDEIVVTAPAGHLDEVHRAVTRACDLPVRIVAGGLSRQASVAAGLASLSPAVEMVLVHDAARPLASPELIRRLVRAVGSGIDAAIPSVPVVDTIKEIGGGDPPVALRTLDRPRLRAVQTPQAFRASVLRRAHRQGAALADDEATAVSDDAGLVEAMGVPVHLVEGEAAALKITTRHDLAIAGIYLDEMAGADGLP
ncbi:2-C-methyl-D-erythritol 4-phosphate cytidylyltransferase [Ruania suaedae]|uniref:2-C-methyl-D-erythritol 4-phosphate cytidylyltransferase n=1 Tax=Ruania suaedae TaxID=2897774 RepID=UPI001E52EB44|nr:2-C-methyl-D-erythritol 4-phosphate cytidylyltransferase [Ruania suaedae]UFU03520.1 2-C-methyl-D-erythritol 4-phosphate cytidylyltransferase [Ruania suaedae]